MGSDRRGFARRRPRRRRRGGGCAPRRSPRRRPQTTTTTTLLRLSVVWFASWVILLGGLEEGYNNGIGNSILRSPVLGVTAKRRFGRDEEEEEEEVDNDGNRTAWFDDDDDDISEGADADERHPASSCSCDDESESEKQQISSLWERIDFTDGEVLAAFLGLLALVGSVVAYFVQRNIERKDEIEADRKREDDLDRKQALDRAREQLSEYVGPIHRLFKTQNATTMQYLRANGYRFQGGGGGSSDDIGGGDGDGAEDEDCGYWTRIFPTGSLEEFLEDPNTLEAKRYRGFVTNRLRPLYERIRDLHVWHSSELADPPTQEEYLMKWGEKAVTSPYNGSININVVFDTYVVWTREFDDIIAGWENENENENDENDGPDYTRMQPTTRVAWPICNYIVDHMLDLAKEKEAMYNKHVKVHKNDLQSNVDTFATIQSLVGTEIPFFKTKTTKKKKKTLRDGKGGGGDGGDESGDGDGDGERVIEFEEDEDEDDDRHRALNRIGGGRSSQ